MTRLSSLLALLFLLTLGTYAQMPGDLPTDGLLSPEETASYIQGLSTRGLYDESVAQANTFLERYPGHPFTETVEAWRIQGLFALRKYADAATAIQDHLKKFPNSDNKSEFLWYLGECLRNTGDYAGALPAYEDMLKGAKGAQAEEARYRLAICLEKLGRIDEAKKHLQHLAALEASAKYLPRIYARHYLATMLQKEGNAQGALEIYFPLLQLQDIPQELRQNLLLDAAYIAFNPPIQNYQLAEELYGTFLAEYANNPQATSVRRNLLSCHYALGHYQNFLELYRELCQNAPEARNDAELSWLNIRSLVAVRHFSDALPLLKTLLANDTLSEARRQQATQLVIQCLDVLRQDQELVETAKKYCQDFPNALDVNEVMLSAICAEERLGKVGDAIADLDTLLPKLAAGNPVQYQQVGRELANLLNQNGDFKRSADLLLELAEKAPESSSQKDFLTKRALQINALTPLFHLSADPRGLTLSKQLSESADNLEERLQLLQARYQFALQAGKGDEALATIEIILPIATPAQQVNWLMLRAQIHRQLKLFSETADDYLQVLKHQECPQATRGEVMPTLLALLYYTNRNAEAALFLPELFDMTPQPTLSQQLLHKIAQDRQAVADYDLARRAFQRILEMPTLNDNDRDVVMVQAAQLEFLDKKFDAALALLKKNAQDRTARELNQSSDALAIQAEIELQRGNPTDAFLYAKQVLAGKDKTALTATIPRARWIYAKALQETGKDEDAFKAATQAFIPSKHPLYAPLGYVVAIQVKEHLGDKKTADELRTALKNEYPDFVMP